MNRIEELLADLQTAHSDLQIDRFIILSNGLTEYGCYKQSLRELHTRFHTMVGYWLELESLKLDEEDAVAKSTEGRRQQLELAKVRLRILSVRESLAESKREFLRFLAHADYLKSKVGELTPERRAEFEKEFWVQSLIRMGNDSPQARKLFSVLDADSQKKITSGEVIPLPELPTKPAEMDVDFLLRMTLEQKLLPCPGPAQNSNDCSPHSNCDQKKIVTAAK